MTTTIYQDIRGALAEAVAAVDGVPPSEQHAYEGLIFKPTTGIPYLRHTLIPSSDRPFSVSAGTTKHTGLYQADLFYPSGDGTGNIESVGDAIKAFFRASTSLKVNNEKISISYAERSQVVVDSADPAWLHLPVTIGWTCHSARN